VTGQLNLVLLGSAAVLLVAVGAVRLTSRFGLPTLLVYLGLGLLVGHVGPGVDLPAADVVEALGLIGLALIIFEGGLTARLAVVRPALPVALTLSTVGVAVSVAVVAVAAHLLLGEGWRIALLIAAAVSPTDAAAVFATLRRLPLLPRLTGILEVESGTNDPVVVLLVLAISGSDWQTASPWMLLGGIVYELVAGAAVGAAAGALGSWYLRRSALPASGLYPLTVLGFSVVAYAGAAVIGASGFLAVYLAAIWLGNADLPHRPAVLGFAEGLAWFAQIGLFVMLGMLEAPSRLPAAVLPALAVTAVLLLLARPLSVLVCATPFRVPLREQGFLSWAGLRGAVPIVLAIVPLARGVPGSSELFDTVFVVVIVSTMVISPTLGGLARRLGVAAEEAQDLEVEAAPLADLHADVLQLRIAPGSRLHGVEVGELRLPEGAVVTLVVREGHGFVPGPTTRLQQGDALLVVTTSAARDTAERRLRAVSRAGRLAGWFGEGGRP
jgi:potassium/hydrogen antiporter